jgi:hypothetical protein
MPKKGGRRFTAKQDRQAQHIADSERKRGKSAKESKAIGYATIQKGKSKKKKSK